LIPVTNFLLPTEALMYFIASNAEFLAIADCWSNHTRDYYVWSKKKSNFSVRYNTDYSDVRPLIFVPEIEDVKA